MIRKLVRPVIAWRPVGEPLCRALVRLGKRKAAGRVQRVCRARGPRIVRVDVPGVDGLRSLRLTNRPVVDRVARRVWLDGWEAFERPLPSVLLAAAKRSHTIVDIGANTGFYSVLMAAVTPAETRLIACEPLPDVLQTLRHNVQLNQLDERIEIVGEAVSDSVGVARFYVPSNDYRVVETSASLNPTFRDQHSAVLEVKTTTLDALVERLGVRVDLLKIDVESQEHRVLAGGRHVLREHRPLIVLEVLTTADVPALESERRANGYDVYQILRTSIRRVERIDASEKSPNQALCPAERTDHLRAIAEAAGMTIES